MVTIWAALCGYTKFRTGSGSDRVVSVMLNYSSHNKF